MITLTSPPEPTSLYGVYPMFLKSMSSLTSLVRVVFTFAFALSLLFAVGCSRGEGNGDGECETNADCEETFICSSGACVPGTPQPSERASIDAFAASASDVEPGDVVTLTWESSDAVSGEVSSDRGFSYTISEDDLVSGSTEATLGEEDEVFTLTVTGVDGEPQTEDLTVTVTPPEPVLMPARVISFTATPESISAGQSATLRWDVRDATSATIRGGDVDETLTGDALTRGELLVSPIASITYTLEASTDDGSNTRTVRVNVEGVAPSIVDFSATPQSVVRGESTTLSWNVLGADTLELTDLDGQVVDISGKDTQQDSVEVTVNANTSYTLEATNAEGTVSRAVMVLTRPALVINSFTATPELFDAGERVVLSWSISGPLEGISIFDDKGNTLDTSMSNAAAGSLFLDPVEGATFRLTALGRDGQMDQATVTIAPRPDPPAIVEFATPTPEVASGDTVTLRWITNGGASVEIVDDMGTMVDISTKSVDVDTVDVVITRNTTFTFTVTNPAGSVSRNLTVNIGNPVMATLVADRTMVNQGEAVTLTWTTTNAGGAINITSSDGAPIDLRNKSVPGDSVTVFPANPMTNYILSVPGFGGPATASVTINVMVSTAITDFFVSPNPLEAGNNVTISWVTVEAQSVTLTAQDSQGTRTIPTGAQVASGSVTDSPAEDTTYILTATGANGMDTAQELVAVFDPPVIDLLEANPPTSTSGQPVTISWQTSNTMSVELRDSLTGSVIPFTDLGNGAGEAVVRPQVTSSYQLFADGVQQSTISTFVTVDVNAAPLRITEMMLDPNGSNNQTQWIEIHNDGDYFVDLGRYFVGAGTSDYTTTTANLQGIIPPKGCVVVGGPNSNGNNGQPDYDQVIDFAPNLPIPGTSDGGVALFFQQPPNATDIPVDSVLFGANSGGLLDESGAADAEVSPAAPEGSSLERISATSDVMAVRATPSPGRCFAIEALEQTAAPDEATGELIFHGYGFDPALMTVTLGNQVATNCSELSPGVYGCQVGSNGQLGDVSFEVEQTHFYDEDANGDPVAVPLANTFTQLLAQAFTWLDREAAPDLAQVSCTMRAPATSVTTAGSALEVSTDIFAAGATEDGLPGRDIPNNWIVEVGYMTTSANPTGIPYQEFALEWFLATKTADVGNNGTDLDAVVYGADVTSPIATIAEGVARLSRDGGATWIYCDTDGSANGFTQGTSLEWQ